MSNEVDEHYHVSSKNIDYNLMKARLLKIDRIGLDIESKSSSIINGLLSIDSSLIRDPQIQITVAELKSKARSLDESLQEYRKYKVYDENYTINKVPKSYGNDPNSDSIIKDQLISKLRDEISTLREESLMKSNISNDSYDVIFALTNQKGPIPYEYGKLESIVRELFEKREQIVEFNQRIESLEHTINQQKIHYEQEIAVLEDENDKLRNDLNSSLAEISLSEEINEKYEQTLSELNSTKNMIEEERIKNKQEIEKMNATLEKIREGYLDRDARDLKSSVLLDNIFQLRLDMVKKDDEMNDIQRKTQKDIRKAAAIQSTYKLVANDNESLIAQSDEARKAQAIAEQSVLDLQTDIDEMQATILQLRSEQDREREEVLEANSRTDAANIRCAKYINLNKDLRKKVDELNSQIANQTRQINELELSIDQKTMEIEQLQKSIDSLLDMKEKKDKLGRQLYQLEYDYEVAVAKASSLQKQNENLNSELMKTQTDLAAARKAHSMSLAEIDSLKFSLTNVDSNQSKRIQELKDEIEELNAMIEQKDQKVLQAHEEIEREVEEMRAIFEKRLTKVRNNAEKKVMLAKADAERQITIIKEENAKQIAAIKSESANKLQYIEGRMRSTDFGSKSSLITRDMDHNDNITRLEKRNAQLSEIINEKDVKLTELTMENVKLRSFKGLVMKELPSCRNDDASHVIREILEDRSATEKKLNNLILELKRTFRVNEDYIRDKNISTIDESAPPSALLGALSSALSHSIKQSDLLSSDLENSEDQSKSILKSINAFIPSNTLDEVPKNIAITVNGLKNELHSAKKQIENLNEVIEQTRSFMSFDSPESLPDAAAKLWSDFQDNQTSLMETEDEYRTLKSSLEPIVGTENTKDMPKIVAELSEKNRQKEEELNKTKGQLQQAKDMLEGAYKELKASRDVIETLQETSSQIVPIENVLLLPVALQKIKTENDRLNNLISTSSSILGCDESQLLSRIKNMKTRFDQIEKSNSESERKLSLFTQTLGAYTEDTIIETIEDLKAKASNYSVLSSQLSSIDSDAIPEQAADLLRQTRKRLSDLKKRHDLLMGSLASTLGLKEGQIDETNLTARVKNLVDDKNSLSKTNEEVKKRNRDIIRTHNKLITKLREIENFKNESDLVDKFRYMNQAVVEATDVVTSIVSVVTRKPTKDVKIKFPLGAQMTITVINAFNETVQKYDNMKRETDRLFEMARSEGFISGSLSNALDYYTDVKVKEKAQEMLSETMTKLSHVREEAALERQVLEARLDAANKKVAEMRSQKASQVDAALRRQKDLGSVIEEREMNIRKLENRVDSLLKVKEELIRFAERGTYDRESLRSNLTEPERKRLGLN